MNQQDPLPAPPPSFSSFTLDLSKRSEGRESTRPAGPPVTRSPGQGLRAHLQTDAAGLGDGPEPGPRPLLPLPPWLVPCVMLQFPGLSRLEQQPRGHEVSSKNFQNPRWALVLMEISLSEGETGQGSDDASLGQGDLPTTPQAAYCSHVDSA